jgi:hypothetical protein
MMKKGSLRNAGLLLLLVALGSWSDTSDTNTTETATLAKDVTEPAKGADTVALFDGKTLTGWHPFNKSGEIKNWAIEDSAMVCLGAAKDAHGGDIVSDKEYENFELSWQWKVTKGGNSGIMYM